MSATRIEQYGLGWHPKSGAAFRIKPEGKDWSRWIPVSAADLAALAAIFNEQPVYLHANNSITTGPEPIAE